MMKIILRAIAVLFAGVLLFIACEVTLEITGMDRISRDREAKLKPIIQNMDNFIKLNGRLPTSVEFQDSINKMAEMAVLRTKNHPYAARKGAKTDLDYMVGIWRADWFHYYKSWDHKFLNASDETIDMMNGH